MSGVVDTSRTDPRPPDVERDQVDFRALAAAADRAVDWGRRRGLTGDGVALVGGVLVALAVGLWLTAGAWGGRPLSGDDTLAHLVRAEFAIEHLIPRGRVDGWHPGFILGYQEFLFLGPGLSWGTAIVQGLFIGLLSTGGALKVLTIGTLVLTPAVVAFLARSFGLSRPTAGVAAVLSLAVNNPFGVGLQGVFNVGLLSHQFAVPFFFLALGGVLRVLRDPAPRWIVLTAFSTSALLLTHVVSVLIFAVVLGVIGLLTLIPVPVWPRREALESVIRREVRTELERAGVAGPAEVDDETPENRRWATPPDRPDKPALLRLAIAFLAAGAISAFWLIPLAAHRDLQGVFAGWGTPPLGTRLAQIWRGELLFRPNVVFLVLAGFAWGLVRWLRGKPYGLALAVTPIVYLFVAHAGLNLWPASVSMQQLSVRGLGYVGILAVLPLADLLVRASRTTGSAAVPLALVVAAGIVVVPSGPVRALVRQMPEPVPQMRAASVELGRLVPDGARFATQRDFPAEIGRTGLTNPDRWLAWASGRDTLNNFHITSSQNAAAAGEPEHILDRPPEVVADALSRLGVTHLVTVSDEAADRMTTSPRFTTAWRSSPMAIFGVVPKEGQPDPSALVTTDVASRAQVVRAEPEHLAVQVDAVQPARATIAVGWSPKWHARFNGRPVDTTRASDGLIEVALPAASGRLSLDFAQDPWDYLGQAITLVSLVAGGWWFVRRRTAARQAAEGG